MIISTHKLKLHPEFLLKMDGIVKNFFKKGVRQFHQIMCLFRNFFQWVKIKYGRVRITILQRWGIPFSTGHVRNDWWLLSQGCKVLRLEKLFKKFYGRIQEVSQKNSERFIPRIVLFYIRQDFSCFQCFTLICHLHLSVLYLTASCERCMHEAADTCSIWSSRSCHWLDQFLTLADSTWILSKLSMFCWIRLLSILLILMGVELLLCLDSISFARPPCCPHGWFLSQKPL